MPNYKSGQTTSILEYALQHLEKEAAEIQGKIDHIRRQLGQKIAGVVAAAAPASSAAGPRKKRTLSAAARKRIAAAQKKRWAEHRKATGEKAK